MKHPLDPFTYVLIDRKPVLHPSNDEWFLWFGNIDNRRVASTMVNEEISVSTVFVGIDRSYGRAPLPLVFETMVFGGPEDRNEWLTATWEEAEAKHAEIVALVRSQSDDRST